MPIISRYVKQLYAFAVSFAKTAKMRTGSALGKNKKIKSCGASPCKGESQQKVDRIMLPVQEKIAKLHEAYFR